MIDAKKLLYLTYGLVPIVLGLDKFTNILVDYSQYVAPPFAAIIPVSFLMIIVGIVEIIAGILVLNPSTTRVGAILVGIWLLITAIDLVIIGIYDIAARDVVIAIGAFALFDLSKDK